MYKHAYVLGTAMKFHKLCKKCLSLSLSLWLKILFSTVYSRMAHPLTLQHLFHFCISFFFHLSLTHSLYTSMKAVVMVVVVVMMVVMVLPCTKASLLPGGSEQQQHRVVVGGGEVGPVYLHNLDSDLATLLRQQLPEIRDVRIVDGPNGPRLDMPLTGCRDSMDCHHRFTNYLGLLVRMMETGRRRRKWTA